MASILHRVGIKASPESVYEMLTTDEGLMKWWTNDVSGAGEVGSIIALRFNGGGPDFAVSKLIKNKIVRWEHSGTMPEAWIGTEVSFLLEEDQNQTFVNFAHSNWKEATDFMAHCSTKWGVFMLSLKDALETGEGRPFPNDIHIDHS